jgi:hypothetical protein
VWRWLLTKGAQSADVSPRQWYGSVEREGRLEEGPEATAQALPTLWDRNAAADLDGTRITRSNPGDGAGAGGLEEEDMA